jgi:hypothetical protein
MILACNRIQLLRQFLRNNAVRTLAGSFVSATQQFKTIASGKSRIASLFRVSYLAADVVRALLEGRHLIN